MLKAGKVQNNKGMVSVLWRDLFHLPVIFIDMAKHQSHDAYKNWKQLLSCVGLKNFSCLIFQLCTHCLRIRKGALCLLKSEPAYYLNELENVYVCVHPDMFLYVYTCAHTKTHT